MILQNLVRTLNLYSNLPTSVFISASLILVVVGTGCTTANVNNNPKPVTSSLPSPENDKSTLTIAVIPATNKAKQQEQQATLNDYLSKTLKRPVSLQVTKDYKGAVDLLVEEKVSIALLGPLSYIEAKQRNPQIEPIAAPINKQTGRPWYKSTIIASSASGIKTLNDLKGKRFGFVTKLSTSGYMVPAVKLLDIGIDPRSDFAFIEFYGSHDKSMAALLDGKVDAVAIDQTNYNLAKNAGKINDSDYQVIWESEPIPQSPIVVSKKLSSQLINELKQAFTSAPTGLLDLNGSPSDGYTLVQDSDYDRIREIKKQLDAKLGQSK